MSDHKHLDALRIYWREHKAFPSMAKLADVLGLASAGGVFKVVGRLVDAGFLERVEGRIAPTRDFFALPVLGKVRAGLPQMEDQSAGQEMVGIEDYLIRHPERTVLCRVRGESMRDAGLLDGDMVVVDQVNNESKFRRLEEQEVAAWLERYKMGDIWEMNLLGGTPE